MPKKDIASVTQYFQFYMENPIRKRATIKTKKHDSKKKNRTSCQSTSFVLETECVQKKNQLKWSKILSMKTLQVE